jgi:hypothetical protein
MKDTISHSLIVNEQMVDVVRSLLSSGWRKSKAKLFYKERNNYKIEIDGTNSPIWNVYITPKNEAFDEKDWKLLQDFRKLKHIGSEKAKTKRLYVNENNKEEISALVDTIKNNNYNVVFNKDYIVFKTDIDQVKVFKVAASIFMTEGEDGWYIGEKRVL